MLGGRESLRETSIHQIGVGLGFSTPQDPPFYQALFEEGPAWIWP